MWIWKKEICVTGEFYLKLLCKTWVIQNEFLLSISVKAKKAFYLKANEHTTITNGNEDALELSSRDVEFI